MQLKPKASKLFLRDSVSEKITFGTAVITGLNSIPGAGVPNLPYAIGVLSTTNNKLMSTSAEAATGSHAGVAGRNTAEKDWNIKFGATADAVSDWADGDAEQIQRAGFRPTKAETSPAQRLQAPTAVTRIPGQQAAAISVSRPKEGHADAYVFIAASPEATMERNGDTICITVGTTRVYVHIDTHPAANMEGLTANEELQVRVAAMNSAGTSELSESVRVTPQA